jgi:prophage regulatory protein
MAQPPKILRLDDVEARTGIQRRTLYNWIDRGLFPRPINLGPRTVGWLDSDIDAWINEKTQASRANNAVASSQRGGSNA